MGPLLVDEGSERWKQALVDGVTARKSQQFHPMTSGLQLVA